VIVCPEFTQINCIQEASISSWSHLFYILRVWTGNRRRLCLHMNDVYIFIIVRAEEFSLVISVENALYLKNGLC